MDITTIKDQVTEIMADKSEKFTAICNEHYTDWGAGCKECPLIEPCKPMVDDTYWIWIVRMNAAAEKINKTNT